MSDQIRASDWCAAHREWSPCPDCETADTIARLTREVAALRLMLRETAQTNATGIDYALRCQRERDTARRWSRLWHAEARRLWREVQALSDRLYCDCGKAHERGTCPWENDE